MNKHEALIKYTQLVTNGKLPILITNDDTYYISNQATCKLVFTEEGLSFIGSFKGVHLPLAFLWDDITDIVEDYAGE